ncbi:hypothetical protein J3R30DRAFT_225541 [Lentinula aciculospora]|uniref:C2H2-type domain-containing protein n=1 Tax=Lentinula aciculospora TaxID=153920 RepID=A0A9W9DN30_9AGAR|nr:hypothetical protein J3R30DRAFT_225541 [Lentinula aciculospora]
MSCHPSLAVTVEDIMLGINLTRETKRHATFFPSKLDLAADFRRQALEEEDDFSTWEFHASVEPFFKRRPRITSNAIMSPAQKLARNYRVASSMSEAQQIAHRYRTGLKIDLDIESTASKSSFRGSSTEPSTLVGSERVSWISTGVEDPSLETRLETDPQRGSPVDEPKLRHSDSRAGALAQARMEALKEINFSSASGALVCPRKGCRATLANVNALTFHLSLHDIEKSKPYYCAICDQGFDKHQALNTHACPSRTRSAPSSPIFATFQHVLTKITSYD